MAINYRKLVELAIEFPNKTGSELLALAEESNNQLKKVKIESLNALKLKFEENGYYRKEEYGEIYLYHFSNIVLTEELKLSSQIEFINFEKDKNDIPYTITHNIYTENLDDIDLSKLEITKKELFDEIKEKIESFKISLSEIISK